jgi:hypothetical protein
MTAARRTVGAVLATLVATAAFPLLAAPATPNPGGSKRVDAVRCKDSICRLAVKVDGECGISVDPDWLFVAGKNVRLVFEILPSGYYFAPVDGIRFKDEYNPAWRSEFFEQGRGEGDGIFVEATKPGMRRQSVWGDLNTQPGVFRYAVTIVNARTGEECRADPGVVNDWTGEP